MKRKLEEKPEDKKSFFPVRPNKRLNDGLTRSKEFERPSDDKENPNEFAVEQTIAPKFTELRVPNVDISKRILFHIFSLKLLTEQFLEKNIFHFSFPTELILYIAQLIYQSSLQVSFIYFQSYFILF